MLYVWRSEILKDWTLGYIIVEGEDEDDARMKAIGYMLEHFMKENYSVEMYLEHGDEDSGKSIVMDWEVFLNDISSGPEERTYIFINGSE